MFCKDKFQHSTKLLYHMLHLHKPNSVHFVSKHMRVKVPQLLLDTAFFSKSIPWDPTVNSIVADSDP